METIEEENGHITRNERNWYVQTTYKWEKRDAPTAKSCYPSNPSNQSTYGSKQNEDMIRYTCRIWLADKPPSS